MADTVVGLVEQINASSNLYNIASTAYGYCTTAAGTQEKAVTIAGFKYIDGVTIHVKFKYANTASSPKLNVNSEGAKAIVLSGATTDPTVAAVAAGTDAETTGWQAGAVVTFTYDGTNWVRDQGYNTKNAGTVTSVRVQASSPLQSSTNTAQNSSLNTTISFINQSANTVLAGPSSGSDAAPTFRSLVAADIPSLNASKINAGYFSVARGGTGTNTLASGEVLIGNGTSAVSTRAIDTTVTANSDHLITSGAVASAINGLTGAMHFIGVSSTAITDGGTENPTVGGATITTKSAGDVVIYGDKEFVWSSTGAWELLGDEGSYALDTAVVHKSDYTSKGAILKGTGSGAYDVLAPNTTSTEKVLYMASSTASWKQLGISAGTWPTVSVTKTVTFLKTATLQTGTAFTVPNVTSAGTAASASVTNAILTITNGTAPTLGTAFTIPNATGINTTGETALTGASINTSSAAWPTISYT